MGRKHDYNYASSNSESEASSVLTSPSSNRRRPHKNLKATPQIVALQSSSGAKSEVENKEKKKKKQKTPQERINLFWEKFSQKEFSKALAVLPWTQVYAWAGERGNEPVLAGYERAAEECRRKVRKIISECKRVNTRYRDSGWDLVSHMVGSPNLLLSRNLNSCDDGVSFPPCRDCGLQSWNRTWTSSWGKEIPSTS